MIKKTIILSILVSVACFADKHHLVINDHYEKDPTKDFLKIVLPPIAGISFLNYAINTETALSPIFLLRGANGLVCGMINARDGYLLCNNEQLLRIEAGIIGSGLVTVSAIKACSAVNRHVVQPTVRAMKETGQFIADHAVLIALIASGAIGYHFYSK